MLLSLAGSTPSRPTVYPQTLCDLCDLLCHLLLLPIEPDANQSLGGVLLEQPSATHAKPLKISTPRSSYDLSWTAVWLKINRVKSQYSILWLTFFQALLESRDRRVDGRIFETDGKLCQQQAEGSRVAG
jgi:hypothetical protein